jgi:hypothetical protein
MEHNTNIPMLSDLVDGFVAGKITEEDKWYPCYITNLHKENKSICWTHDSEFKGLAAYREEYEKTFFKSIWNG